MTEQELAELLVGDSAPIRDARRLILKIAPTGLPVLLQGPTGVGKEVVARALHRASNRPGQFVPFNTCAIPETLFESELFGHERGAFSGALDSRVGLLTQAHRGTAFFDEISTLPSTSQVKLLRAIEEQEYRPLGAKTDCRSDFRVVAASNVDLHAHAVHGDFRPDLVQRLSGVVIELPPLASRRADIRVLAERFRREVAIRVCKQVRFSEAALQILENYEWPGNVRELLLTVERAVLLADGEVVDNAQLRTIKHRYDQPAVRRGAVNLIERQEMLRLLAEEGWDTAALAVRLGTHRATVYRWMRRLEINLLATGLTRRTHAKVPSLPESRSEDPAERC